MLIKNIRTFKQTATYWAAPVQNGFGGYSFSAPVQFLVRWEERREQFINLQGKEEHSKAVVFVPQPVDEGGYLFLGESDAPDPTEVSGAYYIQGIRRTPDLRGLGESIRVFL